MTWELAVSYCCLLQVPLSFLSRTDLPLCPQRCGCLASAINSQKLIKNGSLQSFLRSRTDSLMQRVVCCVCASGHTFIYIPDSLSDRSILVGVFAVQSNLSKKKKLSYTETGIRIDSILKVRVKWSRYRPGVAQRVGRDIALLFHDRGPRRGWVVSSTPQPHFTPGKDPVPILQEAGCARGPVWTGGKSRPHRDSIPDRPASSSVAIPTELPGPHRQYLLYSKRKRKLNPALP